jgi:O-antigen ligase
VSIKRLEYSIEIAVLLMACIIPFSAALRIDGYPVPLSALWGAGIVALSLSAWVRGEAATGFRRTVWTGLRERRLLLCTCLFVLVCGLSGVRALSVGLWAKELLQLCLFFGVALTIWLFAARRIPVQAYIVVVLIAAAAASAVGIFQYFRGADIGIRHFITEGGRIRAFGGLQYPNKMGVYLAGVVPAGLALGTRRDRYGWTARLLLIPVLVCLVLTLSRSAWIGGTIGVFLLLIMQWRKVWKPTVVAAIVLALVAAFVVVDNRLAEGAGNRARRLKTVALRREVDKNRMQLLKLGFRMIAERPLSLGIGLGNSERVIQPETEELSLEVPQTVRPDLRDAESFHNTPVQLYVETGPLGVAAGLALLFCFIRAIAAAPLGVHERPEFAGLAGGVAAIVVTGAFDWLFTRGTGDMMFYVSALLLAMTERYRNENGART